MYATPFQKALSALAAFGIVLLIAFAVVFGLRVSAAVRDNAALLAVFVDRPPPPPLKLFEPRHKVPPHRSNSSPKHAPAPANVNNQAAPITAPPVVRPLIVPPPIPVASTRANVGAASSTGASTRTGPGQGAGGSGTGNGGGGQGGDGDGPAVGPHQIHGKLSFGDLPDGLIQPGSEARVGVRYTVEIDGRVSGCHADEPSGIPQIDAMACRLIEQRFRFRPARDRSGHPVRATISEAHSWYLKDKPEKSGG